MIALAEATPELRALIVQINDALQRLEFSPSPRFVPECAAPANLPDPASWRSAIVFVKSIDRLAVSNGTNWLRADTGASL